MTGFVKHGPRDESGLKAFSIGYDAKRAFFNRSGLGNYSRNLLAALAEAHPENRYYLFSPRLKNRIRLANEDRFILVEPQNASFRIFGFLWRSKFMTADIKKAELDIFHGLSHELPLGIEKTGARSVVTIHDLIFIRFPELYNKIDAYIYRTKMMHACEVSDRIIAISHQTRADLIDCLKVAPEKIVVIHQGCDRRFRTRCSKEDFLSVKSKARLPGRYILYVGAVEKRKNLLGLLKAIHICKIEVPLVVIGHKVPAYYKIVSEYIESAKLKNIFFRENISNEDLPAIYQNAECLVYPSFYEGFGIPILEAIVSETPVITSKEKCFTEAGGPGTIYIDPEKPEEIGEALTKVLGDETLRTAMKIAGKEFAGNFDDDSIRMKYMQLYRSLLL